jgi:transposase
MGRTSWQRVVERASVAAVGGQQQSSWLSQTASAFQPPFASLRAIDTMCRWSTKAWMPLSASICRRYSLATRHSTASRSPSAYGIVASNSLLRAEVGDVQRHASHDGRRLRRYRKRWKVERLFAWLKRYRRICVRWERKAANYLAFVHLGCIVILLRHI